jgi:hypothetical protein
MKNSSLRTKAAAMAGLLILCTSVIVFVSAHESAAQSWGTDDSKKSLEGVWLTQVQRINCDTGDPIALPGQGLITFARDGTLSETTAPSGPQPMPFLRGPGHGVWDQHSQREYTVTIINQRLNPDGSFAGWSKVRGTFYVAKNGNEFTAASAFEIIDPNGNVLFMGCSTVTGTRFQH